MIILRAQITCMKDLIALLEANESLIDEYSVGPIWLLSKDMDKIIDCTDDEHDQFIYLIKNYNMQYPFLVDHEFNFDEDLVIIGTNRDVEEMNKEAVLEQLFKDDLEKVINAGV